jgi:hypothetical protein
MLQRKRAELGSAARCSDLAQRVEGDDARAVRVGALDDLLELRRLEVATHARRHRVLDGAVLHVLLHVVHRVLHRLALDRVPHRVELLRLHPRQAHRVEVAQPALSLVELVLEVRELRLQVAHRALDAAARGGERHLW